MTVSRSPWSCTGGSSATWCFTPGLEGSRTLAGRPPRSTPRTTAPLSRREAKLEKVEEPLDYRVVAGPASSPTYRVGVRYPLAIKSFDVALVPPAYTGVEPSTVKGGDLRVIEGTDATFRITFDSPPAEASLVMTDPSVRSRRKRRLPRRRSSRSGRTARHTPPRSI